MDSDIRFSIIFPSYNEEDHLEQGIEAVLHQSYGNIELIIIDDGSQDKTGQIGEHYSSLHKDVRLIRHAKNMGRSFTRNEGLREASGDYILFLDPDDTMEPDLLKRVNEALRHEHYDVVSFSYTEQFLTSKGQLILQMPHPMPSRRITEDQMLYEAVREMELGGFIGHVWDKAYRLDFLRQAKIQFPHEIQIEGALFDIEVMKHKPSMITIPDELYHCRNFTDGNRIGKFLPNYLPLHRRVIEEVYQLWLDWGLRDELSLEVLSYRYMRVLSSACLRLLRHGVNAEEAAALMERETKEEIYLALAPHFYPLRKENKRILIALASGRMNKAVKKITRLMLLEKLAPEVALKILY